MLNDFDSNSKRIVSSIFITVTFFLTTCKGALLPPSYEEELVEQFTQLRVPSVSDDRCVDAHADERDGALVQMDDTVSCELFFDWLLELKFQVMLAFYLAMQVEFDEEDWYGSSRLWVKPVLRQRYKDYSVCPLDLFLFRLLDNLNCLDNCLYKRDKSKELFRKRLPFFLKVAYEISATLLPFCNFLEEGELTRDDLYWFLKTEYNKSRYPYVFVRRNAKGEYPYFTRVALRDEMLRRMLDINATLFKRVFDTLPWLAHYPCLPSDWSELCCKEKANRFLCYKACDREYKVSQWFAEGFFKYIEFASFHEIFFWLRLILRDEESCLANAQMKIMFFLRVQKYMLSEGDVEVIHSIQHVYDPASGG